MIFRVKDLWNFLIDLVFSIFATMICDRLFELSVGYLMTIFGTFFTLLACIRSMLK